MKQYFTDFFNVTAESLEDFGAFNISLLSDLPLFIDPFLLFNSEKDEYRELHNQIIKYLQFLRVKSENEELDDGLIEAWFRFPEIRQNWFGFSVGDNNGSGLGKEFAKALHRNLHRFFYDFGSEQITKGSHLEKLCLITNGVGKDNISDFTTNLIHGFLLSYTQEYAAGNVSANFRKTLMVPKVRFDYTTESWVSAEFDLPFYYGDYVLLTPKDLLTKDETWINKLDLYENFEVIPPAISDAALRAQVNNYFAKMLPINPKTGDSDQTKNGRREAAAKTIQEFPQIIDY